MLDFLPIWAVFVVTVAFALAAAELGFRLGVRWKRSRPDADEPSTGVMVGASLALLAFFLAFLVGMAVDRFDGRRAMVVDESNAIGTTWLRAGYLPEPYRTDIRTILVEYADQRLAMIDEATRETALDRSAELLDDLWAQTEDLVRDQPDSESVALFVETTNETIDVAAKRAVALLTWRVPWTIWLAAYFVAGLSMVLVGFHGGLQGGRNPLALIILALVFAAVMNLIVDLDRPYEGLLQVSQQAMLELREAIGGP